MVDQPRPVWLKKKQRDELAAFWKRNTGIQVAADVVAAWDAAPADATEAARRAVDDGREMADDPALAVLRALGMPDA